MQISFTAPDGKMYKLPISQVVVYTDDGEPCALAYQHAGLIIYADAAKTDFAHQCDLLKIKRLEQLHV